MEPELLFDIPVDAKFREHLIEQKPMTMREAVIQAHIELGRSRESAELSAKASDAVLPEAASLTDSPVKPGMERVFIDALKNVFRQMEANPDLARGVDAEINKRAKQN